MNNRYYSVIRIFGVVVTILLFGLSAFSQNNLSVSFPSQSAVPDFLNICGDLDTMIIRIGLQGASPQIRQNIDADVSFFKGVRFNSIISGMSSTGVTLNSQGSPSTINLSFPDLSPGSNPFADVAILISADCSYLDSIAANNGAQVLDIWDFSYDLGPTTGLQEQDNSPLYRDAFVTPAYQMQINSAIPPLATGDCFTREVQLDNSGLIGYVDTLEYTATEGSGFSISEITANGIPLAITKNVDAFGDTIITAILDGSHFALNTIGASGPLGDGDLFFDPNETLIIQEQICFVDCAGSTASFHSVGWGCYGQICAVSQTADFLSAGNGQANVVFDDFNPGSFVDVGYCQIGQRSMEISNLGSELDPGFATMWDLSAAIVLGNGLTLSRNGVTITSLTIAGVNIPSPGITNPLDNNPLFAADPDGPGVGLEDEDGDLFFDDLPLGNSFVIDYQFEYDCAVNDTIDIDSQCGINEISVPFSARVDYTDQCEDRLVRLESSFFRVTHSNTTIEAFSDADAFTIVDTFNVSLELNRSVFNFAKNCGGSEQLIAKVFLPPGLIPVIPQTNLYYNRATVPVGMLSNTINGDTLELIFDGSTLPFINGIYDLDMAFTSDCSIASGSLTLYTQFELFCPSCTCTHLWFCDYLVGPQMHVTSPPCAPVVCSDGLKTTTFDINRTTFGFSDDTYTTPFDQNLANKKVAISCDSVAMNINAAVGDMTLTDSAFIRVTYSNIDESTDPSETFLYGNGTLEIKRGAFSLGSANVNFGDLTVNISDDDKELIFSLDNAVTDIGVTLTPSDSLFFIGNFKINENGPFGNDFRQVPNLRAEMFSVRDGVEYSCDNFGDNITLAKSESVVASPNSSSFPSGCEDVFLNYRIITINNGFKDYFGNEYRPSLKADSITINFDTSLLSSYDIFIPEVSIPNHPVYGNSFFPVPGFDQFPDGNYVARFDTINVIPTLNDIRSYDFNFRIRVVPSCRSESGSINGDNIYNFDPTIFYKDRYYASYIGDGSCSETQSEILDNDIIYSDPPLLNITPASDPNVQSTGDTIEYNVQICNGSFVSDAGLNWFAFIDSNNVFVVYSIEDVTDPGNIIDLAPTQYGSANSWFAINTGLLRSNVANTFDDNCNIYRVKGRLNACGLHTFQAISGWNCTAYNPSWTPDDRGTCSIEAMQLTGRSLDGQLAANIQQEPLPNLDLCDTNEVVIIVRNTDLGSIYDMRSTLFLPTDGFNLVAGSVEIAYPSNTAFIPALADPTFIGSELRGDKYEYADFTNLHALLNTNGFAGFDNGNPTGNQNELLIKFKFTTDCNFLSGSQIFYEIQGVQGCGNLTNLDAGETVPVTLSLPAANPNLAYFLRFDPKTAFVSNSSGQLNVIINNIGTASSSIGDSVEIKLPNNFTYDIGSAQGVIPGSYNPGEPVTRISGPNVSFVWGLPSGVPGGDSIAFNFKVISPFVACSIDSIDVVAFTKANVAATCTATGTPCQVEVVTSNAGGSIVTELPIYNQTFLVQQSQALSTCFGASTESIIVEGLIENIGNDVTASDIWFYYRIDDDMNGLASPTDAIIDSIYYPGPINSGSILIWTDTLVMPSIDICHFYVYADTSLVGGCDPLVYFLPAPRLINAGADIDHCSINSTSVNYTLGDPQCGSNPELSYNWRSTIPGTEAYLSSLNVATPSLNYIYDGSLDTLVYILETTRSGCFATQDTVLIALETCLCIKPEISSEIVTQSRCNETIGSIAIDLVQDENLYDFIYNEVFSGSQVIGGSTLTNIGAGGYNVVIVDQGTGTCTDSTLIAVGNLDGPVASVTTTNATCSAADGSASLLPIQYNYLWSDGNTSNIRNDLTSGQHVVQIENPDIPGCFNYQLIEIGEDNNLSASFTINSFATCGLADGSGTITVTGGSGSYSYSWSSGTATNNMLEGGTILVTVTDNSSTGCTLTVPILMTNSNDAAATITDTLEVSCYQESDGGVLFDVNFAVGFTTPVDTIITDGINQYNNGSLPAGHYCIMMVDSMGCIHGGDCFEVKEPDPITIQLTVDPPCTPGRSISSTIKGGVSPYTSDWSDLPGTNDPLDRMDLISGIRSLTITDANSCSLNIPSINVSACNSNTIYFNDTIFVDETDTYCIDTSALSLAGILDTIINDCPSASGTDADFTIDQISFCISYNGLGIGRDSACILICDDLMACDTIYMLIDVISGTYVQDTVVRYTDTVTYNIDTSSLSGTIISVVDKCPNNNGNEVTFTIDPSTNSVDYFGFDIGTDTICLEVTDDLGGVVRTTIEVTSRDPIPEIYVDTIYIGQEKTYPFDLIEVGNNPTSFVMDCNHPSDTSVSFSLDNSTYLIDYLGLRTGTDSVCIIACNVAGVCDSVEMRITVEDVLNPPIAVDDSLTTIVGTPVVYDVLFNDTLRGTMDSFYILDQAEWGSTTLNLDNSITYNPDPNYCERWDSYTYVVCNPVGCDTATVNIYILCTDIKIFNALSPNGDGINDYFHIANIDDFPNNELRIYNRWGNMVYEIKGYNNAERRWRGTWQDEKDLPDGTYYYQLDLNDDDNRSFNGYIEIFR